MNYRDDFYIGQRVHVVIPNGPYCSLVPRVIISIGPFFVCVSRDPLAHDGMIGAHVFVTFVEPGLIFLTLEQANSFALALDADYEEWYGAQPNPKETST